MAFSARNSSLFLFFTTIVLLSTQIHARDSYFFGKFHRESPKDQNSNNVLPLNTSEKTTVQEQEQEQDPSFVPDSENGYGLYGHENNYDDKVKSKSFSTPSLSETEESSYNNEEYNNKYGENVKEESFSENNEDERGSFYNSNAYGTELERETPYKGYSQSLERQGMSDTRFMAKGNYYYDLYNDRNHGHFYRKPHQKSPSGYYSSPATEENNYQEEKSFKDPYDSKWEKNLMNHQPVEFVEEEDNHFKP